MSSHQALPRFPDRVQEDLQDTRVLRLSHRKDMPLRLQSLASALRVLVDVRPQHAEVCIEGTASERSTAAAQLT